MLSEKDAAKIIDGFLKPRWSFVRSPAEQAELRRLAEELKKASGPAPRVCFSVISDIHIQYWDTQAHNKLKAALTDLGGLNPKPEALVVNGDLGDGRPEDYAELQSIMQANPHPDTVCYTVGNHEFYKAYYTSSYDWSPSTFPNGETELSSIARYLSATGMPGVYYDRWIQGYHFIFLGSERYRQQDPANGEDAWLSPAQLEWLGRKLQENYSAHRPMFVFLHQPLPGTVSGSSERGVVQHAELRRILSAYPEVVFFTGHTHWELRLPGTLVASPFTMVNSSSVSYPYGGNGRPLGGSRAEGLVVEVQGNRVHIRGRDFGARSWIPEADYTVTL